MDINSLSTKLANEEGVGVVLTDPLTGDELLNDEGKPMTIFVVGKDSHEYKAFQSEISSKFRGKKAPTFASSQRMALELLARCTKGFENLQMNGNPLDFTLENAIKLYDKYPIIRDQIDEYIAERTNFLGKSKQT